MSIAARCITLGLTKIIRVNGNKHMLINEKTELTSKGWRQCPRVSGSQHFPALTAALWQHGSRQGTHFTQWHGIWYLGAFLVVSGSLGNSVISFFVLMAGKDLSQLGVLSVFFRGFFKTGVSDFKQP